MVKDYRSILRQLGGAEGVPAEGWAMGSGAAMCEWQGLECNGDGELIGIDLAGLDLLGGSIPPALGQITTLERIRLNATRLAGPIPGSVAALNYLVEFTASDNSLTGTLPNFYSAKLQTLNVSFNQLVGSISSGFYYGALGHDQLHCLDLEDNRLTGTLSEAMGMWTFMETLSLSNNDLSGTLPAALGLLAAQNLKYLYLDGNLFIGTLPEGMANSPDTKLQEVWLHENLLSGTIPAAFADIPSLKDFYVDGNKFTGEIPPDLCTPVMNADFFQDQFVNVVDNPAAGLTPENVCDKIACPVNTFSLEGMFPCKPCPDHQTMPYLGGEEYCLHKDTTEILKTFYSLTNGQHWNINNWFHENVDFCQFSGLECNVEGHIVSIQLSDFGLSGTIPPDLGMLEHLTTLDLSDNEITGPLPSDLRFAAELQTLDITGNQIRGPVPPLLCKLPGLDGNGDTGEFTCHFLACPPGTASPIGRELPDGSIKCMPCHNGANIMGLKDCKQYHPPVYAHSTWEQNIAAERTFGIILLSVTSIVIVIGVLIFVLKKLKRRTQTRGHVQVSQNDTHSVI